MFGSILSGMVKIATLPIDVVEIGASVLLGDEGDRDDMREIVPLPSTVRDKVCKVLEDI